MTRAEYDAAPGAIVCDHTSVNYYDENNLLSYTGRVLNDGVTALRTFSADSLEDGSKYVYTAYEDGRLCQLLLQRDEADLSAASGVVRRWDCNCGPDGDAADEQRL